jgi:hypothetical protein
MTTPRDITKKQETIISLLFRFRFLDRTQIQKFLNHKDEARINDWLKDLTEKEYIDRSYSKRFPENTRPAVCHLAKNGIALIKAQNNNNTKLVQKFYREKDRSKGFIDSCQLVADIYLDLRNKISEKVNFTMSVKSDYSAHPLTDLLNDLKPHAYIEQTAKGKTKHYFLEVLADLPVERLRQRVKKYLSFYQSNEWEGATSEPFPTILVVCPDDKIFAYIKKYAKTKISALDEPISAVNLTTVEKVKDLGITGDIWKKV